MNVTTDATEAWTIDGYGRPEDLRLAPRPVSHLAEGDLLISVEAASLNPLDLKLIGGALRDFMPVEFPFTPGSDVCGRIVARGPDVQNFKVGDRVVGMTRSNGGMARQAVLSAQGATARISDTGDVALYAPLPEAGMTALAVLRDAGPIEGRTIAVIGATGGIGLLLCQLAKEAGATVIATAAGGEDAALVRANGADESIDYADADPIALITSIHPEGVDVLIDLINQFDGLLASAGAVKPGGRLVSTLLGPDPSEFPEGVQAHYVRLSPSASDLAHLVSLVQAGKLTPTVSQRFAFADAREAYLALRDGHVRGKIVVEVR